jgi:hypothetical protein
MFGYSAASSTLVSQTFRCVRVIGDPGSYRWCYALIEELIEALLRKRTIGSGEQVSGCRSDLRCELMNRSHRATVSNSAAASGDKLESLSHSRAE